jgi:hypothetical protein
LAVFTFTKKKRAHLGGSEHAFSQGLVRSGTPRACCVQKINLGEDFSSVSQADNL